MSEEHQPPKSCSPSSEQAEPSPSAASVYDYLVFGLSLPERALRGTTALVGGAIKESAALVIPMAFRNSRSYQTFIGQMLDFMVNDVGGTAKSHVDDSQAPIENYVARKAVSSFVDLAGVATLHVSPLMLLAVVSDLAYGSKAYLQQLSEELKQQGVIDPQSTIDSTADLLEAVANASSGTAEAFDMPPISIEGLKQTVDQTAEAVAVIDPGKLIPLAEIDRLWTQMNELAVQQNVSLFELSSAVTMFTLNRVSTASRGALSTIRVAGNLFDQHVFDHYRQSLDEIQQRGLHVILAESSRPYIEALWYNFSTGRDTVTAGIVTGRYVGQAWAGLRSWFGGSGNTDRSEPEGG